MTRNGKIARLPRDLRHELNRRLNDGEQGTDLVQWLNGVEEVQEILSRDFGGRPITEQNLSEWKQGGFREWQRQEETHERLRSLVDFSDDLEDAADDQGIPGRLAAVLAAELAAETQQLLEDVTDPKERFRLLSEALRQLNDLREGDAASLRIAIERDRWEIECERREQDEWDARIEEARIYATAPIHNALRRSTLVEAYGGGENGEKIVDFLNEIDEKCRRMRFSGLVIETPSLDLSPSNQTEIKPDQTESE